jgi:Transcriptional regulator
MLNEKPLDKITVKDLVAECEINRNTFYYHYQDIYALIKEIFQTELERVIGDYNDTLSWEDSFLEATKFAMENKKAIYHVYNSVQRDVLEEYLYGVAGNIMMRYVERASRSFPASQRDQKLIATFYQSALTCMVMNWISSGMKQDPEMIIGRIGELFDGNIAMSLQRSVERPDTRESLNSKQPLKADMQVD